MQKRGKRNRYGKESVKTERQLVLVSDLKISSRLLTVRVKRKLC